MSIPPTFIKHLLREEGTGGAEEASKLPTEHMHTRGLGGQLSVRTCPSRDVDTHTHTHAHTHAHTHTLRRSAGWLRPRHLFYSHSTSPKFSVSPSLGRCAHSAPPRHTPTALTSGTDCSRPRKTAPFQVGKALRRRRGF